MSTTLNPTRNFELDWLRVATVLLVFFHHVAMPFNGDTWHIMNAQSSKVLDDIMVFLEQWRLPLLLLISGAGTVMAFSKRSAWQFIKERSYRLLIPLIFGALVIIPPQTYFEFINNYKSYADVYPGAIIHPETNHLWFIKFLFVFSLVAVPLILFMRSEKSAKAKERIEKALGNKWGLLMLVLPLIVLRIVTKIYFPNDEGGIENLSKSLYYFYFFIAGIILFSCRGLWGNMKTYRFNHLIAAAISLLLFYGYYYLPQQFIPDGISVAVRWSFWWVVCSLVSWNTMLVILGYAQVYLNRPHKWLPRLNEAIYPFYILHQTVIVALAYFIVQWEIPIVPKLALLAVSSFAGVVLIYSVAVYPFRFTRMLFGMKVKASL
jgi:glucan biosynthesis protein C